MNHAKRIFVQMVSFRDPECHHTIADLFAKAAHPERVSVGLCWQYDPAEDAALVAVEYPHPEQVRVVQYHVRDADGAGWARSEAQKLWSGEEYVLQIQAHHRFEPGWDDTLIELLETLPTKKAVLTAWLPDYQPPDNRQKLDGKLPVVTINRLGERNDPQIIHLVSILQPQDKFTAPFLTCSWVGNFMFARAEVLKEVPPDPHIYFWGEELNYSARLWTHGYDIYHLDRVVLYHHWNRLDVRDEQLYRNRQAERNMRSFARNLHVLGLHPAQDETVLEDIERTPLGTARSLADYFSFIGVDMTRGNVAMHARIGQFGVRDEARDAADTARAKKRIFVAIASFRDPETKHTISDMFAKAVHPDRIYAGVCHQLNFNEDEDCRFTPERPEQVKIDLVDYRDSRGANWARARAMQLMRGEDFVLIIDSHMRFQQGWDATLVEMVERCPSKDVVISTYLPGYTPPDKRDYVPYHPTRVRAKSFGNDSDPQLIHLTGEYIDKSEPQARLYQSPFVVANFMFAAAEVWKRVPIDPHIYFYGDEISLAMRLWTHGIDVYQPDCMTLYHWWNREQEVSKQPYRKRSSEDSQRTRQRVRHLIGLEAARDQKALVELDQYGLGDKRKVDDFWQFAGVNPDTKEISDAAAQGLWNEKFMATKKKAPNGRPRIFVQIASYRDPECQHTVKDLFDKATHPERISVGICWQYVKEEDAICFEVPYPYPDQVRVHEVDARKGKGVCWARMLTQGLWQGEEFTLQVDSHMRFEPGWDEMLLDMYRQCGKEKSVLTCYPPGYTPPNNIGRKYFFGMSAKEFDERGIFKMKGAPAYRIENPPPPLPMVGAFASACMLFGPSSIIEDVPYDPNLYFFGEEITLAARLWTKGYDIYHPNTIVVYHDWDRSKRPTHFQDHEKTWWNLNLRSLARVRHIMGTEISTDPDILVDLDKYGLGKERSLSDYEKYAGVDFARKHISEKALQGLFQPRIFVQIASYRDRECQHTVKDLFDKATHPDRISVGICWQFDEKEDADCFAVPYPYPKQVRVINFHYRDSLGASWARKQAVALRQGEEYTLAIDAHMRFEPGWDETLLAMLAACDSKKPILSSYPASYTPPNELLTGYCIRMGFREFKNDSKGEYPPTLRYNPIRINHDTAPDVPFLAATISNNFIFARSTLFDEVPIDPNIYFFGDDVTYAARVWTHGWDIFSPHRNVLYHFWERKKRRMHWQDHGDDRDWITRRRCAHLMGVERTVDPRSLVEIEDYGFGNARSFGEYQAFCGVNFAMQTISEHAKKGLFSMDYRPRIFVRIASYRDSECQWTVKDLFEKATYPDRIFVGICWQFDEKEDEHCFTVTTRPDQVRVYPVDWREAEGVCWARAQTEMLYEGEEYTLQIDSHMRFAPGWDEWLIDELAACPSKKPIISCSPAKYTPPHNLEVNPRPNVHCINKPFSPQGNVRGRGELLEIEPEVPLPGAFIAAGFVFSRSEVLKEVPYDPYLYFDQEEIVYAARLYTHGWDLFSTRQIRIFHYYNVGQVSGRPMHWGDLKAASDEKRYQFFSNRGITRLNHLTRHKLSDDPRLLVDIEKYGLGNVRTIEQYEEHSGIDFKNKIVHPKAIQAGFVTNLIKYRKRPIPLPGEQPAVATKAKQSYGIGDILPHFVLPETTGKKRALESNAGRPALLFLLRYADEVANVEFFKKLDVALKQAGKPDATLFFMFDADIATLTAYQEKNKIAYPLLADTGIMVGMSLGITSAPCAFLLDHKLQIKNKSSAAPKPDLPTEMVGFLKEYLDSMPAKTKAEVVAEAAPVLMLPEIFPPELCDELIDAFRKGEKIKGEVVGKGYVATAKERTDFIVPDELRAKLDLKLSHSLFPEIEKIFGFKVTGRENYKIGLYSGDDGGFFAKHRDNYEEGVGYRRVAVTLNLSDDYKGGGLRFPEYDLHRTYRPGKGGAVAFPCTLAHEAMKVTKGERFVLVGFFHGEEEEAFRQHMAKAKNQPLLAEAFVPNVDLITGAERSRDFYRRWKEQAKQPSQAPAAPVAAPAMAVPVATQFVKAPIIGIGKAQHKPVKIFESRAGVVFDNFLPQDLYDNLRHFCVATDYEHINTKGKISRAWHVHDGFPLRSLLNAFYYPDKTLIPMPKPTYVYPTETAFDAFIEYMREFQPQVEYYTGKPTDTSKSVEGWSHFSVTSWLYPPGTGLAMHDDGSGVYTGAYAFFMNKTWRSHWGGMLLLMDESVNDAIHAHRRTVNQHDFHKGKWLQQNTTEEMLLEHGMARCIFPKANRIVFIANDAYHMVTRVNEAAGDNLRMSLAGFFDRSKKKK